MLWSRPFDDPIPLPGRRELVTLRDAGGYIAALPRAKQASSEWQATGKAFLKKPPKGGLDVVNSGFDLWGME